MDLQAIEARLEAAPEPDKWQMEADWDNYRVFYKDHTPGDYPIAEGICQGTDGGEALAEFIAHAPEDIRALLAEVKRLRRFLNTGAKRVVAVEEIEGLRAQVEAAKAAQLQIEEVKALHCDVGASQGYSKSGRYEVIEHCCGQCGSFGEYGAKYPCPTMRALGVTE